MYDESVIDVFQMFFKKLLRNDTESVKDVKPEAKPPPGLQAMAPNLQRKFARGVQYNSK